MKGLFVAIGVAVLYFADQQFAHAHFTAALLCMTTKGIPVPVWFGARHR